MTETDNSTKANLVAKIFFIAGGIILFIVLVIFIFRLVPVVISNISDMSTNIRGFVSGEQIKVTSKSDTVEAKTPVQISFQYEPEKDGDYYIEYDCINNFFFDIKSQDGSKRIICDTPFKLGTDINSISLIPIIAESNNFVDSKITISYKDNKNNTLAKGSTIVTIQPNTSKNTDQAEQNPYQINGSLSNSQITSKPVSEKITPPPTLSYNSTKDLAVYYIRSITDESAFEFHVYNYGNTTIEPWEFSYTDAENPSRVIISPMQASLKAGQGLAITVRFDSQDNTRQSIEVVLDPLNKISETNESNNNSEVVITGDRHNSSDDDSYDSNDDADLTITSLEVGRLSGNRFVEDDEIDEDDTAAIRFVVKNKGGESTGSWRFNIDNLPYDNDDTYRSKSYSSLRPGQSLEIIADFDNINEGTYSITVEVDSDDDVDEEKENNNTESETLEVNR